MTERIDSHHHLWRYNPLEYDWIDERMQSLRRDYLASDLESVLSAQGIQGSVAVQARQSLEETHWLLEIAAQCKSIRGVVGWAPIASASFAAELEALAEKPALKGLRHVIQAEPDDGFILRDDFNKGIAAMATTGLVFDILILHRHLPQAIEFVDRHPHQKFVLDHLAKPAIARRQLDPWREYISRLAERENVYCKVSGMVTEASWADWSTDDLTPYWECVLGTFTPQRLMFGSDWPVCLVASSYARWFDTVRGWIGPLSASEQERILGTTAIEVYGLKARV